MLFLVLFLLSILQSQMYLKKQNENMLFFLFLLFNAHCGFWQVFLFGDHGAKTEASSEDQNVQMRSRIQHELRLQSRAVNTNS